MYINTKTQARLEINTTFQPFVKNICYSIVKIFHPVSHQLHMYTQLDLVLL